MQTMLFTQREGQVGPAATLIIKLNVKVQKSKTFILKKSKNLILCFNLYGFLNNSRFNNPW